MRKGTEGEKYGPWKVSSVTKHFCCFRCRIHVVEHGFRWILGSKFYNL